VQINSWCFARNLYGYWVIWTTPGWGWWVNTHWGWNFCGLYAAWAGWYSPWWEWGAGISANFGPGVCYPYLEASLVPQEYVYGNGLRVYY
jgi:hypothetical protein